jgi:bacteriochlorophyll 4-vinyl reductase
MSQPRIGRALVASLHQAIADVLPMRLEFYENWLNPSGLREGTIGLAPLSAVLSFLRSEGETYNLITARAGEYAADWTVSDMSGLERYAIRTLPAALRIRLAMRTASALVRATYPGSRAIVRVTGGSASVDLRGSLFCEVRETSVLPLCGFYAAAMARVLHHFALQADVRVNECRAWGGRRACQFAVLVTSVGNRQPSVASRASTVDCRPSE